MKTLTNFINAFIVFIFALLIIPAVTHAHQPRITENRLTNVPSPEISKAYYAKLAGVPDVYVINSTSDFDLYVNILVPDIPGQNKDVSAEIIKVGNKVPVATLVGTNFTWKKFYEPFGADTYLMGPEYKARAEAGVYEVHVSSANNDSKYSLAIGELEAFDVKEGLSALKLIPQIKKNFFNESPIGFVVSPFGWGTIVMLYLFAFIFGFIYRFIAKKFTKSQNSKAAKNINKGGRLIRAVIGIVLLLVAMLTTWNLILIFISGFCIFESLFSWCVFNQMMGKSTCEVE